MINPDQRAQDLSDAVEGYFEYFEKVYRNKTIYSGKKYAPVHYSMEELEANWPEMDLSEWDPLVLHYLMNCLPPEPTKIWSGSVFDREDNVRWQDGYLHFTKRWSVELTTGYVREIDTDGVEGVNSGYDDLIEFFSDLSTWEKKAIDVEGISEVSEMAELNDASKREIGRECVKSGDLKRLNAVISAGLLRAGDKKSLLFYILQRTVGYGLPLSVEVVRSLCSGPDGLKFHDGKVGEMTIALSDLQYSEHVEILESLGAFENAPNTLSIVKKYQAVRRKASENNDEV